MAGVRKRAKIKNLKEIIKIRFERNFLNIRKY